MEINTVIVEKIKKSFPETMAIYLFGSFQAEYKTPESDIDIAVLAEIRPDKTKFWNLAQEIAV